jgi:hemoglobin-like flavoprotein
MYDHHIAVIEGSIQRGIEKVGLDALSANMFKQLFEQFPETASMFDVESLEGFAPEKFSIITELILDSFRHPEYAESTIQNEILRHHMYELYDKEYYFTLIESVKNCIQVALGDEWTPEMQECWDDAIAGLQGLIQKATRELG